MLPDYRRVDGLASDVGEHRVDARSRDDVLVAGGTFGDLGSVQACDDGQPLLGPRFGRTGNPLSIASEVALDRVALRSPDSYRGRSHGDRPAMP
jgi:hypothetical protein